MSIQLNDNIKTNAPKPSDSRYFNGLVTWTSISEVNTNLPSTVRYQGLTVNIQGTEYWYENGILDTDLVIKTVIISLKTINSISLLGTGDIPISTLIGYTPYNATNPSGYISGITSLMVTTALGFTPYSATNPSGYISRLALSASGNLSYDNSTGAFSMKATPTFTKITLNNAPSLAADAVRKDYVDGLIAGLSWQLPVINQQITPPVSHNDGDRYLVGVGGTDAWVGYDNNITTRSAGTSSWSFSAPSAGRAVYNQYALQQLIYSGLAWVLFGSAIPHNSLSGLQGGTTSQYYHLTAAQHAIATQYSNGSQDGILSAANYNTFNAKQNALTLGNLTSSTLTISGGTAAIIGTGITVELPQALATSSSPSFSEVTISNSPTVASDAVRKDYVDNLINGLSWQYPVLDFINTPPVSPTVGDRYIVGTSPSGAWVGHANAIATRGGSSWTFSTPMLGWAVYNQNTFKQLNYNGGAWVIFGGGVTHNSLTGLQGGNGSTEYYHLSNAQYTLATQYASGSQGGLLSNTDWSTFNSKQNTITAGNITSSDITITGGTAAILGSGVALSIVKGNLTETGSGILTITGGTAAILGSGLSIQVTKADTTHDGYISSTDRNTFNNKQPLLPAANATTDGYLTKVDRSAFNNKASKGFVIAMALALG